MIKTIGKLTLVALLATMAVGMPVRVSAQTTNTPAAPAKPHPVPFHGKVAAVDASAKTITLDSKVAKRTFKVNADTKIVKDGKPGTLADAAVGDDIGGSYLKEADGTMTAKFLRIGAKPQPGAPAAAK